MSELVNGGLAQCSVFRNPAPHSETQVYLTVKPMTSMRAKMRIADINAYPKTGETSQETVVMYAVSRSGSYPEDGSDENNTYAKFSPSGRLELTIANPALIGQFTVGEEYYLDFTLAAAA